jgi:hypothetical protein
MEILTKRGGRQQSIRLGGGSLLRLGRGQHNLLALAAGLRGHDAATTADRQAQHRTTTTGIRRRRCGGLRLVIIVVAVVFLQEAPGRNNASTMVCIEVRLEEQALLAYLTVSWISAFFVLFAACVTTIVFSRAVPRL